MCTLWCQFLWNVRFWLPLRYSLTFICLLCTLWCQFLWIILFWLPLRYSLAFIYLVYSMIPVSLDCPFLIVPSVFSNVYSWFLWIVLFWLSLRYSLTFIYSFSGLSFLIVPSVFSNVFCTTYFDWLQLSLAASSSNRHFVTMNLANTTNGKEEGRWIAYFGWRWYVRLVNPKFSLYSLCLIIVFHEPVYTDFSLYIYNIHLNQYDAFW